MEPEEYVRRLGYDDPREHSRISRFYTSAKYLLDRGGIYHPAPPYVHFITGKNWNYLARAEPIRKKYDLGIICSDLKNLDGHINRLSFLNRLQASGIKFVIWGRGEEIARFEGYKGFAVSKWNAHASCKYTIVLENSRSPLYWTEKLTDALLSFSHPIYYGSPDACEYFPSGSFTPIDIDSPSCFDLIRKTVASNKYEASLPFIRQARRDILHKHNVHAFISKEIERHFHY